MCSLLLVTLYVFRGVTRPSSGVQETVCSLGSFSVILDSVFLFVMCCIFARYLVGPRLVCVDFPQGSVHYGCGGSHYSDCHHNHKEHI